MNISQRSEVQTK